MQQIDRITGLSVSPSSSGSVQAGTCSPYTYPSWSPPTPDNAILKYPDDRIHTWKHDPLGKRNFHKLKRNGVIAMSPYSIGTWKYRYMVASINCSITAHALWYASCKKPVNPTVVHTGPLTANTSWTENFVLNSKFVPRVGAWADKGEEIRDAVASTQMECWNEGHNTYDLMTELAEMRESISYIFGKNNVLAATLTKLRNKDPDAYKKGRRLSAQQLLRSGDTALKRLGGRWMEYRYAIMPLMYSYKDILETWNDRNAKFHTTRSKRVIQCDTPPVETELKEFLLYSTTGTITIKSMSKAKYDLGSVQRLSQSIGFNPFRTAWELIPMSFVVDWFLNIGDVISTLTSIDYASQRMNCTIDKRDIVDRIEYFLDDSVTIQQTWTIPVHGEISAPYIRERSGSGIVYEQHRESYGRSLWTKPEPKLIYDPLLSWKRFIDAAVLSYQPTKKILRSLR